MSMPVATIYCDRCNLQSNTMLTWGRYVYQQADGRLLYIDRTIGWCHDCRDLVPVEDFSGRQGLEEQIGTLDNLCRTTVARGFLRRLWHCFSAKRYEAEYWQEELAEALRRRDFFRRRQSPPRCLRCGATEFEMPRWSTPLVDEAAESMAMRHPGCGGMLWMVDKGTRVAMRFTKELIYDEEGLKH